jgi:peptide deformylase
MTGTGGGIVASTKLRVRYKDTDCMKVVYTLDTRLARCIIHEVRASHD